MKRKIVCDLHGENEWRGEVICTRCDAVYRIIADVPMEICECGDEFLRAICASCFEARRVSLSRH